METRRLHSAFDAFAILGLAPRFDLDAAELEARYLARSRECHPDFHTQAGDDEQAEMLRRSAELNDAYRILRDPWRRAEHFVELADPDALERTKTLSRTFLVDAMELAEEVESARDDDTKAKLRERLTRDAAGYLERVRGAVAGGRIDDAAVLIHEARYVRKALRDIDDPR